MPDSLTFRTIIDRLDSRFGLGNDLNARLALLRVRHNAGSFESENAANLAALQLIECAAKSGANTAVLESGALLTHPLDLNGNAKLEEVVTAAATSRPGFASLVSLLVVCGYAHADHLSYQVSGALEDSWPSMDDLDRDQQNWLQRSLGRAAAAAYFANAATVATRLAALQLEIDCGGWGNTGEFLLAIYVLTRNETDLNRHSLLRRGVADGAH